MEDSPTAGQPLLQLRETRFRGVATLLFCLPLVRLAVFRLGPCPLEPSAPVKLQRLKVGIVLSVRIPERRDAPLLELLLSFPRRLVFRLFAAQSTLGVIVIVRVAHLSGGRCPLADHFAELALRRACARACAHATFSFASARRTSPCLASRRPFPTCFFCLCCRCCCLTSPVRTIWIPSLSAHSGIFVNAWRRGARLLATRGWYHNVFLLKRLVPAAIARCLRLWSSPLSGAWALPRLLLHTSVSLGADVFIFARLWLITLLLSVVAVPEAKSLLALVCTVENAPPAHRQPQRSNISARAVL